MTAAGILRTVLVAALALLFATPVRAATITITCGSLGVEYQLCREGAEAWAAETGHRVKLVQSAGSTTDRLGLYQQLLAAKSSDIDVFLVDVVWPGILGRHFVDLRPHLEPALVEGHFPALRAANTVDGELKAVPWFTDVGLLYYRADLLKRYGLEVPGTWAELEAAARAVAAAEPEMYGFVFQARAYEGLTCNALEWIDSFGGAILGAGGAVALDEPAAVRAVATAAGWVGTIAPDGVLAYGEEEARGVFQSGRAVFMRNWPYAWTLANGADSPVRGLVGVAPLPRGGADGRHSGTLGGWSLAVSRYSRHPETAAALVAWLTRPAEQARRARVAGLNPTYRALYRDAALLAERPFLAALLPVLDAAVARPSRVAGPDYNRVSSTVWNAVHDALAGRAPPKAALSGAAERLRRLARRWSE